MVLPWESHGRGHPRPSLVALGTGRAAEPREGMVPSSPFSLGGDSSPPNPSQLWGSHSSPARDNITPGSVVGLASRWEMPLPPHRAGTLTVAETAPCPGCAACHGLVLF